MMSPEVAADAAEPPEVVALAAVFPEAMVPAAVSPEVAAHAAEPPEEAVLASAPCVVVAPSNALSARHVTVEGTVDERCTCPVKEGVNEHYLFPDVTTAEPPEVSVVSIYELSACPVMAMEAVCNLSVCPVMAMEVVCKFSACPVTAMEAIYELL